MGNKTSLNKLIGKAALSHHIPGDKWPIRDQFVGIEIELENLSRQQQHKHENDGAPYWEAHADGSLRNGIEYTLREPLMGSQLSKAISYFYETFTEFTDGPRTSIHVHLNMRQDEDSFESLKNLLVLYYMYEDAFFRLADNNRKWCAYCNPFEDNPPHILTDVLKLDPAKAPKELFMKLHASSLHNTNRYYGLNITALHRFGTLEFRHFPLVKEERKLVEWVMLLMELKVAARRLAEEGLQVNEFIRNPEDVTKLQHYFPMFWGALSQYVDPGYAYVRMVNVMGLTIQQERATGDGMGENKAWGSYITEQTKRGKVVVKLGARRVIRPPPEPDVDEDMEELFEEAAQQTVNFGGAQPIWPTMNDVPTAVPAPPPRPARGRPRIRPAAEAAVMPLAERFRVMTNPETW